MNLNEKLAFLGKKITPKDAKKLTALMTEVFSKQKKLVVNEANKKIKSAKLKNKKIYEKKLSLAEKKLAIKYSEKFKTALLSVKKNVKNSVIAEMIENNPELKLMEKIKEGLIPILSENTPYVKNELSKLRQQLINLSKQNQKLLAEQKLNQLLESYNYPKSVKNIVKKLVKTDTPQGVVKSFRTIQLEMKNILGHYVKEEESAASGVGKEHDFSEEEPDSKFDLNDGEDLDNVKNHDPKGQADEYFSDDMDDEDFDDSDLEDDDDMNDEDFDDSDLEDDDMSSDDMDDDDFDDSDLEDDDMGDDSDLEDDDMSSDDMDADDLGGDSDLEDDDDDDMGDDDMGDDDMGDDDMGDDDMGDEGNTPVDDMSSDDMDDDDMGDDLDNADDEEDLDDEDDGGGMSNDDSTVSEKFKGFTDGSRISDIKGKKIRNNKTTNYISEDWSKYIKTKKK